MTDLLYYFHTIFFVAILFQSRPGDMLSVFIFALTNSLHTLIFGLPGFALTGFPYHGSAALLHSITVALLAAINKRSDCKIVHDLMLFSIVLIVVEAVGCMLWYYYFDPIYYNRSYLIVYAITLLFMVTGDDDRGKSITGDHFHNFFSFARSGDSDILQERKEEKAK